MRPNSSSWLLVAGLLLPAASCRESTTVPFDQPFELRVGDTAQLPRDDLRLTFRRVASDSRCPRDVQCPWAGEALVTMEGSVGGDAPVAFELRLPGGASSTGTALPTDFEGYEVRLLRLEPYPVSGVQPDSGAHVATLTVRRS